MTWDEEHALLSRFSRGELDRRTLQIAFDRDLDFADTLRLLHQHDLKLPRLRSAPDSPGLTALRAQLRRAAHE